MKISNQSILGTVKMLNHYYYQTLLINQNTQKIIYKIMLDIYVIFLLIFITL
jgi:hypothetical protein